MILLTPNTPYIKRTERLHGQGTLSYTEDNRVRTELIHPQAAPDPIRQGSIPARPARMPIPLMQLNIAEGLYGIPDDFLPGGAHALQNRLQTQSALQIDVRAQNAVGIRPNVYRPPAVAYGSLFSLGTPTYDLVGNYYG